MLSLFYLRGRVSFATPWTAARQTPLSMGFPRQEYWSGWPFPPPGDLPDPGNELISPALAGGFFHLEGVPDLPVAPQDEAGLTTTWPRGWFHIPKDPDFPVPS